MEIYFVTTNYEKYLEAKEVLADMDIKLEIFQYPLTEIQTNNLVESVIWKGVQVFKILPEPYIVEDTGLFIKKLNGFPGVYSSYIYKTIGLEGVLKLLDGIDERDAYFEAVGFLSLGSNIFKIFREAVQGVIAYEIRGNHGFGYDPIFIPRGYNKTFGELPIREKNRISHRGKLFRKIGRYIKHKINK